MAHLLRCVITLSYKKKKPLPSPSPWQVRLSVRNLPPSLGEVALRQMALDAAKGAPKEAGAAKVTQVKIVRDEARLDERGEPRSRGFGFVQFSEHAHALAALEALADNEKVLAGKRLPLVEFAVDNVQKLRVRDARQAKAAGKGKGGGKGGGKGAGEKGGRERLRSSPNTPGRSGYRALGIRRE